MYIHVCVHIYVHIYIYIYTYIYTDIHICIYTYLYIHIHICIYIYTNKLICIYIHMYIHIETSIYICKYIYSFDTSKYAYTCLCVNVHIQEHLPPKTSSFASSCFDCVNESSNKFTTNCEPLS
jgi:hypothetical protein